MLPLPTLARNIRGPSPSLRDASYHHYQAARPTVSGAHIRSCSAQPSDQAWPSPDIVPRSYGPSLQRPALTRMPQMESAFGSRPSPYKAEPLPFVPSERVSPPPEPLANLSPSALSDQPLPNASHSGHSFHKRRCDIAEADEERLRRSSKLRSRRDRGKLEKEDAYMARRDFVEVVTSDKCERCTRNGWRCVIERHHETPRRTCLPCGKNKCSFSQRKTRPAVVDDGIVLPADEPPIPASERQAAMDARAVLPQRRPSLPSMTLPSLSRLPALNTTASAGTTHDKFPTAYMGLSGMPSMPSMSSAPSMPSTEYGPCDWYQPSRTGQVTGNGSRFDRCGRSLSLQLPRHQVEGDSDTYTADLDTPYAFTDISPSRTSPAPTLSTSVPSPSPAHLLTPFPSDWVPAASRPQTSYFDPVRTPYWTDTHGPYRPNTSYFDNHGGSDLRARRERRISSTSHSPMFEMDDDLPTTIKRPHPEASSLPPSSKTSMALRTPFPLSHYDELMAHTTQSIRNAHAF